MPRAETASARRAWADLAAIVRRARTLDDTLAGARDSGSRAGSVPAHAAPAEGPFEWWCRAYAAGDRDAFARRLGWDGLDEASVRAALARPVHAPGGRRGGRLPRWAKRLDEVVRSLPAWAAALRRGGPVPELERLPPGEVPAFVEVWVPFVRFARRRAALGARGAGARLRPGALVPLEGLLLTQLSEVSARTLYAEFDAYRAARRAGRSGGRKATGGARSGAYDAFVDALLGGAIVPFLTEYATLARVVMTLVDTWVATTSEFVRRLDRDLPAVARAFGGGRARPRVVLVEGGLSDRHDGGRRVLAVTFAGGSRVVYKPRDAGLEVALAAFLRWLAHRGLDPAPEPVRVLPRRGYAWFEFVAQAPARDRDDARGYYRRAGALLFLAHLLGGRDLHMENVVAGAGGPFLVDAETLLQPEFARGPGDEGRGPARPGGTFVATGLLTRPETDAGGAVRDIGGLCGGGGWPAGERLRWLRANTGAMRPGSASVVAPPGRNAVRLRGRVQPPRRFQRELEDGFATAYRFAVAHRNELAAAHGPLRAFAGRRTRLILRPTVLYAALQSRLAAPACQREGVVRSFLIDALNRVFLPAAERPLLWPLAAEERRALERLDVPTFSVATDGTEIVSRSGEAIAGSLALSGWEAMHARLRGLGPADLAAQLETLRAALAEAGGGVAARAPARPGTGTRGRGGPLGRCASPEPLDPRTAVEAAREIARELRARAVAGPGGGVAWPEPTSPGPERQPGGGLPWDLYHGAPGVALFLAAFGRVAGDASWAELARAACRPLAAALARGRTGERVRAGGIGACGGLGGVVYALTCIARLLDDGAFAALAERAASGITEETIRADDRLDVAGGAAGAALGLLALWRHTGAAWALERAAACGDRLLATQTPAAAGGAAWAGRDGAMQAGFAHGAAGIAYALARLHRATGDPALGDAVRRGRAFERSVYSPDDRNWPVAVRAADGSTATVVMNAWCHGAPGIALARAGEVAAGIDEGAGADLDKAVEATLHADLLDVDHVCCGNIGLTEIMLTVAQVLGRAELIRAAGGRVRVVLTRARTEGGFRLRSDAAAGTRFAPGFFRGVAGIGYGLLRLARPEALPSVLAFQPVPDGGG